MAVFLGCTSTGWVGLCFLWFFGGSTGSGSGFKASQKTGKWLEVSSDRLGELGIDDTFKRFRFSMHILTIKYL